MVSVQVKRCSARSRYRLPTASATSRSATRRRPRLVRPAEGYRSRAARPQWIGQNDALAAPRRHADADVGTRRIEGRPLHEQSRRALARSDRGRSPGHPHDVRLQRPRDGTDGPLSAPRHLRASRERATSSWLAKRSTPREPLLLESRAFSTLSGGERQRVVIAGALAQASARCCSTNQRRRSDPWLSTGNRGIAGAHQPDAWDDHPGVHARLEPGRQHLRTRHDAEAGANPRAGADRRRRSLRTTCGNSLAWTPTSATTPTPAT